MYLYLTLFIIYKILLVQADNHAEVYHFCACAGDELNSSGESKTECNNTGNRGSGRGLMRECDEDGTVVMVNSAILTEGSCLVTMNIVNPIQTSFITSCNGGTVDDCRSEYNKILGDRSLQGQINISYRCLTAQNIFDVCSGMSSNTAVDSLYISSPRYPENIPDDVSCQCDFINEEHSKIFLLAVALFITKPLENCLSIGGHNLTSAHEDDILCALTSGSNCLPTLSNCKLGTAESLVLESKEGNSSFVSKKFLIRAHAEKPFNITCKSNTSTAPEQSAPITTTTTEAATTITTTAAAPSTASTATTNTNATTNWPTVQTSTNTSHVPMSPSLKTATTDSQPTTSNVMSSNESPESFPTAGQLVGIIMGVLFVFLVLVAAAVYCYLKRRNKKPAHAKDAPISEAELGLKKPRTLVPGDADYVQLKPPDIRNTLASEQRAKLKSQSAEPNEETLTQSPSTYTDGQDPKRQQDSSELAGGHYEEIEDIAPADQISEVPPGDDYAHVIPKRFRTKQSTEEGNAAFDDPNDTILVENDVYHRQPEEDIAEEPIPQDTTEDQADDYGPDNDTLLVENDVYHTHGLDDENPSREDDDDADNDASPGDNDVHHQALDEGDRQGSPSEDATAGDSDNDTTLVENDVYHTAVSNE